MIWGETDQLNLSTGHIFWLSDGFLDIKPKLASQQYCHRMLSRNTDQCRYLFHKTVLTPSTIQISWCLLWKINSYICLSSYNMRHMLTLITGNWVQPCQRREFWFVTCSRQVTVCISPDRQAIDEILTRKNTERTVGVNYCDIFRIAHLH